MIIFNHRLPSHIRSWKFAKEGSTNLERVDCSVSCVETDGRCASKSALVPRSKWCRRVVETVVGSSEIKT